MKQFAIQFEEYKQEKGMWFSGLFLYCNMNLKRSVIFLSRLHNKIERFFELLTWIIVVLGWFSFAFWIFLHHQAIISHPKTLLFFWSSFDPLIFFFLLTLWFDLFLAYKRRKRKIALKRIKYKLFENKKKSGLKYNIANSYSDEMVKIIQNAFILASKLKQSEVRVIHLFRVLLSSKKIQHLFIRLNVNAKKMIEMLDSHLIDENDHGNSQVKLSEETEIVLFSAFLDAFDNRHDSVGVLSLINFCYENDKVLADILYELEIDSDKIANAVEWFRINDILLQRYKDSKRLAMLKPGNGMNRAYTAIATPYLNRLSHDLTLQAKYNHLEICVGREKEINSVFEAFTSGHNGVILVGYQGAGKSTVINGIAQLMVTEHVPNFLKDKRLVELDVSRLISGVSPAQAEERLLTCISELNRSGNIILYIDNIENLIGVSAGSAESLDLSEVLAEAISRHHLFCLASATKTNYAKYIENQALGNVMTSINIEEPEINEAIKIVESKVGSLESRYGVYIIYDAIEEAVKMSSQYIHDKYLPLKAIELLEQAAIISHKEVQNNPQAVFCTKEHVAQAISDLTGIPVTKIGASEQEKLLNLERDIHIRMVGQEEAVKAVSASLRRARAELKSTHRPIASFLFLGPTGVGKTELAKSVAQVYFNDEKYMIRLDMSEYQRPDSVKKIIGDVDGTLGYLTEAVRKQPFSLILLDEIEKAHPDILNLFLQLLDDGRLTDGQGRTISFTESIIIATSNIGAVYIQDEIKKGSELNVIKQGLIDNYLTKHMRPELVNRFDGIIVFKPLSQDNIVAIAKLMLNKIAKMLEEKGIKFRAEEDGIRILAEQGYDPKFGARPLRRLLQDKVENQIANLILANKLKRRDMVVINEEGKIEVEEAPKL